MILTAVCDLLMVFKSNEVSARKKKGDGKVGKMKEKDEKDVICKFDNLTQTHTYRQHNHTHSHVHRYCPPRPH